MMLSAPEAMAELRTQKAATLHWYQQYTRLKNLIENASVVVDMTKAVMTPKLCPYRENHRGIDFCETCYFKSEA